MGLAQTGTGKTAAFVLPLLQHLISHPTRNPNHQRKYIKSLILVPTRELAEQVLQAVRMLANGMNIKSNAIYGGVRIEGQIKNLRNSPEIIVACPGRLMDHIRRRTIDLSKLEVLILDEADHMFDMGFMKDVRAIISTLPVKRQTMMFSATMPAEIRGLAVQILKNPITIQAGKHGAAETVSHTLYPVKDDAKTNLLEALLTQINEGSVLVFTRTKHRAKRLADKLYQGRHSVTCIQGNLSQSRRREAMEGFRKGTYRIMVATDIAARGIDISSVSHVINYDMPDTIEAYTHRIGRTGRAAKTGSALTLITRQDEGMVRRIEASLKAKIKRAHIH
jgi:ATP-dependent RNA helicase RhlE